LFRVKTANFLAEIFVENIFKILTSVLGAAVRGQHSKQFSVGFQLKADQSVSTQLAVPRGYLAYVGYRETQPSLPTFIFA
jgi:hypothetical protein